MTGPLHGYRVLDTSAMVSGPLATMWLADQGAEVIKVENPAGGDLTRSGPDRRGGMAAVYLNNNRNKRSVTIDLKRPEGLEVLMRLAAGVDVFVQNFRPGVVDRMGIGEEAVRRASPEIVYASISGFGENGPYAAQPVYDPLIQALSGLATVQAGSDEARPRLVRTILPDKLTGIAASQAITAALLARERGAGGQHVRISMLATLVAFLWPSDMGAQTFVGDEAAQQQAASFIDLIYETRQGYISVAVQTDREWQALTRAIGRPELADDERFATPAQRHRNIDERLELTQQALRERTAEDWLALLRAEGVPCAPVLTRGEMVRHPQILDNAMVLETDHPLAGRLRQARPPAEFSGTPTAVRRGAPALGEDTDAVLAEHGYSSEQIDELRRGGVAGKEAQ